MEKDNQFTPFPPISPTKPLHVRKLSSQYQPTANSHQDPHEASQPYSAGSTAPDVPPRTSSLPNSGESIALELLPRMTCESSSVSADTAQSGSLGSMRNDLFGVSAGVAPSISTSRSTVSSVEGYYLSSRSSSAILGDFIPINAMDVTSEMRNSDSIVKVDRPVNPYEFEPITPYIGEPPQTTMTEFLTKMTHENATPVISTPRQSHTKNALSEGNGFYHPQKPSPLAIPFKNSGRHRLQRSESSPSITPLQFPVRRNAGQGSDFSEYGKEDNTLESPPRRSRREPDEYGYRDRRPREERAPQSLPSRTRHGLALGISRPPSPTHFNMHGTNDELPIRPSRGRQPPRSPSPIRANMRSPGDGVPNRSSRDLQPFRSPSPSRAKMRSPADELPNRSSRGRQQIRSPPKTLDDVFEIDEVDVRREAAGMSPLFDPMPKRSRSPMKKMFGEHGWLGQSPNELKEVKLRTKRSSLGQIEDSNNRQKKTGMMGRLKNKFGEFAEKADINSRKSSVDKRPTTLLTISLGPPEQAQITMELELMLVHTGNNFLMNEFSLGRMAVDTIKKTVDTWKAKGRAGVIEFMYDQVTQRELVAANQHTFRFHGQRAGDAIRVNSMLYNWKQVANQMSIRTFCNADTVVLKLLFDIEQILELLGASEPVMLRVQQIRSRVNDLIRKAREKFGGKTNSLQLSIREGSARDTHSSVGSRARGLSTEDPYGGLKLVPDFNHGHA